MTPQEIRAVFNYAPDTGLLFWNIDSVKIKKGAIAGGLANGYIQIKYKQKKYFAHRLIWCHVHGEWPKQFIDHIDGNKSNNRIENLRDVSNTINQHNHHSLRPDNRTGVRGVLFRKRDSAYIVQIRVFGKNKYVGYYKNLADAINARAQAELLRSKT
jgi:hypothetical protein